MPAVPVEALRQKYRLLLASMPELDWPALAARFGKPVGTVRYWGHGSDRRAPDQMPASAVPVLIELFASLLPPSRSADEVRRLVLGPAATLEEETSSAAPWSLAAIVAREGKTGTARIIPKPDGSSLVEVEGEVPSGTVPMRLGKAFRIEFPIERAGTYAVALQHAQQVWAVLPARVSDKGTWLLIPGGPANPREQFMAEHRDAGLNRFVCLQSPEPFPAVIDEHRREGSILDKRAIEALAARYESVPVSHRACHVLATTFERNHDSAGSPPAL